MYIAETGRPLKRHTRRKHPFTLSVPQRKILTLLSDEPGLSLAEITAENMYKAVDNVERALSGLISKGLITYTMVPRGDTAYASYMLTNAARRFLAGLSTI